MLEKGSNVPHGGDGTVRPARLSVTVTRDQRRKLKRYCAYHDVTICEVIRGFIDGLPEASGE